MVTITIEEFLTDSTGAKFTDVVHDQRIEFQTWLNFFNEESRQIRMEDSEIHHLRPALAGIIRELERSPSFHRYFATTGEGNTARGRQAIGVIVRMIMTKRGWQQTGRKGSLGQRAKTSSDGEKLASHNTSGLSLYFQKAEHYERRA